MDFWNGFFVFSLWCKCFSLVRDISKLDKFIQKKLKKLKGVSLLVFTLLLGVIFRPLRVTKSKCVSFGAKDAFFINNLFINPIMYFIIQFTKFWWWDVSEITSSFVMIVNFFHYLSCMYLDNRSEHFGKSSRYNIKINIHSFKIEVLHEMLDINLFQVGQIRNEFADIQSTVKLQKPEELYVCEVEHFLFSQS